MKSSKRVPIFYHILTCVFYLTLFGLCPNNADAQSTELHLILEMKWAKQAGKDVTSAFLVPKNRTEPVIFLSPIERLGGKNVLKWPINQTDARTLLALLNKGIEIRVIAADDLPVNTIKDKTPKGFASFNKKDVRGKYIRARQNR